MDTRTSNVPVCLFQHFRITICNYTIKKPVVKCDFTETRRDIFQSRPWRERPPRHDNGW